MVKSTKYHLRRVIGIDYADTLTPFSRTLLITVSESSLRDMLPARLSRWQLQQIHDQF